MKTLKWYALQVIIVILTLVFILPNFIAPSISKVPFDKVRQATLVNWNLETMPFQDRLAIKRFLSVDPTEYKNIAYYKNADVMQSDECLIVELKDLSQAKALTETLKQRIEAQRNVFKGYAPKEAAKLDKAIIDVQANMVLYVVSDQAKQYDQQFLKGLR